MAGSDAFRLAQRRGANGRHNIALHPPIDLYNRGYLYGRDDGGNALPPVEREGSRTDVAGGTTPWQIADDTYFVCTPEFDCPVGRHDWLTRLVLVGRGRRIPSPDHTVFAYFVVRIGSYSHRLVGLRSWFSLAS